MFVEYLAQNQQKNNLSCNHSKELTILFIITFDKIFEKKITNLRTSKSHIIALKEIIILISLIAFICFVCN